MLKQFSPKVINGVLFVTASLLLWGAPPALAKDSAPAWLHDLAQAPLPAHDDDAVAVILLDDTEVTVQASGVIQTLHRQAFRILRPEARDRLGGIGVPFDNDTKISYLKAWTITKDGRDLAVGDKDVIERGYLDAIEYTDMREKTLRFAEANSGSVIGYEYLQQNRPYTFEDSWEFQDSIPVKLAKFNLHLPPGWGYKATWFNHPEQAPQTSSSGEYAWQVSDLPAVHTEREMPPWRTVAGWMGIKYFPDDPAMRSKSAGSWSDIGVWYNGLTQTSRNSTPAIHQKVAELTTGITDPLAQIRALTEYLQRNIRYFAVEIGIGGYQPHNASEVFQRQWGDCKDKVTLLSAMLKEIGVDSYYVIVNDFREGVHPDYPSLRFNHVIVAIRLSANVSDASLYSVVNDPKLGKLLIFDPTNEYVPLGYIPYYEQNTYGLAVGPDGGQLISLPVAPGPSNRLLRTAQLSLSNTGALSGEVKELSWGSPAALSRSEYIRTQPAKRPEILETFLQNFLPDFSVTSAAVGNLDQYNSNFMLDYKFVSNGYARMAGNELLLRPRVLGDKYTYLLDLFAQDKPRQYGVEFESADRQDDVFDITLPDGYVLDGQIPAATASCDFATYTSKTELKGNVLHYVRTFQIQKVHVPKENLADLKDFLQKVAADQSMYVALRPAGPDAAR